MSFLAPMFLAGALAVALPVIFHLIRRTTRQRTVFSSLMFLEPTPPRLTRRSRLEHLLLLALRCGVLCLLALGFARPFVRHGATPEPPGAGGRRTVVLVDTSASMRRANLWAEARRRVESVLRRALPSDQVALFTFDVQARPLVTFEQWNATALDERAALASRQLDGTSPGWSATHLDTAVIAAAEALADSAGGAPAGVREIVLVSDLQEGSRLGQLQGYEWPKGIQVAVERLQPGHPGNAGLQRVAEAAGAERKPAGAVRVRVSNAPGSTREQFQVGWADAGGRGFAMKPLEVYVPAGQNRVVAVPVAPVATVATRIVLRGDDEEFDNSAFVVPVKTVRVPVLYLGSESERDSRQPLYFLRRAFQETQRQVVQVLARSPRAPLSPEEARAATLFIVTDSLSEESARLLRDQATAGKTLFVVLTRDTMGSTLAALLDRSGLTAEEASPGNYAMLADIDFTHPLFAPFADPRFSDFTKIHFWKYRRIPAAAIPGARVLAKFDRGDVALLEVPAGKGRIVVLASGWQPEDSQLALSTKFVPLLYALLESSGAAPVVPPGYVVGDTVTLSALAGGPVDTAKFEVVLPDGAPVALAAGETNFTRTSLPGIYTVAGSPTPAHFAVNLDPAESRTAPLPADELERLGVPLARPTATAAREAARTLQLHNAELENRQKLWRWLLLATLVVLIAETWLAGRAMRRPTTPEGATP